jgi:hypothetical protein
MMGVLFIFSFATYGLSEYHWYLLGGMSVVTTRLINARTRAAAVAGGAGETAPPPESSRARTARHASPIRPRAAQQFIGRR